MAGRFDSRLVRSAFWVFVGLGAARRGLAQPLPQSGEIQVNAYTLLNQTSPAVAVDGQGAFVVTWEQFDASAPNDIMARRFNSAGTPLGGDFQVNVFTTGVQRNPSVGRAAAGGFVVTWLSNLQDGDADGVFARRFDSTGGPLASEFQVTTHTAGNQTFPRMAMRGEGDFVIVWSSEGQDGDGSGVFGRQFDSSGTALASEFQVNSYVTASQGQATPFMAENGSFVVSWSSIGQDGDANGVFARRFASDGTGIGVEFQVNSYTVGAQQFPSVVQAEDGAVVAVWQSQDQDGSGFGIFGRAFEPDGHSEDPEDGQVNDYFNDDQVQPSLHLMDDGDQVQLVVVWSSELQDGDFYGVFGRSIDQRGAFSEEDFRVNDTTLSNQRGGRIAGVSQRFVVVWQSAQQDGQGFGVFARRFVLPLTLDVDGDGEIQPLTDGLLILRYDFGFRGDTLVDDAVSPACTRCTAPVIEEYLGHV